MWGRRPVIPACGRLRQESCFKFQVQPGLWREPLSQKKKIESSKNQNVIKQITMLFHGLATPLPPRLCPSLTVGWGSGLPGARPSQSTPSTRPLYILIPTSPGFPTPLVQVPAVTTPAVPPPTGLCPLGFNSCASHPALLVHVHPTFSHQSTHLGASPGWHTVLLSPQFPVFRLPATNSKGGLVGNNDPHRTQHMQYCLSLHVGRAQLVVGRQATGTARDTVTDRPLPRL